MKRIAHWLAASFQQRVSDIASALAHAAVKKQPVRSPHGSPNRVVAFLVSQQERMPDFLRLPIRILTIVFDLSGLGLFLRVFRRQSPGQRSAQMDLWRHAFLGPCRDLMRFYDSLITLAWLDAEVGRTNAAPAAPAITSRTDCEVAVVGSGPGGAIAGVVWAEAGARVTMFEEGQNLPLESCKPFTAAEMAQKYRRGGLTAALGAIKIAYVEAACVGGGSEINSGLYHRTPPELLEQWARQFRLEAASPDEMRPHFEACERDFSVSLLPGAAPGASLKLHDGALALGWSCQEVPRWFRYAQGGEGERQSMTRTSIPRFAAAGGTLVSGTRIVRVRKDRTRWLLDLRSEGRSSTVSAETLVLAGGAIGTPALLQRSSLGQNAGRHLQMHPTIKVVALFDDEVNAADMGVPVHQVKQFAPRFSFGCSISSQPFLALAMLDHPEHAHLVETHWKRMAIYYAMIVPEGHGRVRTLPGFNDPLVTYRLSPGDLRTLGEALQKLCELLLAAGARSLFPSISGQPPVHRRDELSSLPTSVPAGRTNLMTIHLFSTCPMGEDRAHCTTDSFGRVHGHERLYVSDASLLPSAPGVNPQGSVMAFARRNALALSGSRRTSEIPTLTR